MKTTSPLYSPISFVGIPHEFRATFFRQLTAFGEALLEIHKQVSPLEEHWKQTVQGFVSKCEERYGLASRDIRLALEGPEQPDMGARVCTNLVISQHAQLIRAIGTEASATQLLACMDQLTNHDIPTPSGLICRGNGGNFPTPLDVVGWAIRAKERGGIWVCYPELTLAAAADLIPPCVKSKTPLILTNSQKMALERIRKCYKIRGSGVEKVAGVWARPFPLLCGVSGAGKTTIIKHLAHEESIPILILDSGAWIVRGARNDRYTLDVIRDSIRFSPGGGIILIDELDKFCGRQSSWDRSIVQEVMALMDGRLSAAGWTDRDLAGLQKWMIVGGGTFQADIRGRSKALGFGGTPEYSGVVSEVLRTQTMIPEELVARFNARWLALEPPDYTDFCRQVRSILEELKYKPEEGIEKHIDRVANEAVASGQNMRFVEAYLSELLEKTMQSDASFFDPSADDYLPMGLEDESDFELI